MTSSDFSARWFMPSGAVFENWLSYLNCEIVVTPGVSGLVIDECPYGLGDLYWSALGDVFHALCYDPDCPTIPTWVIRFMFSHDMDKWPIDKFTYIIDDRRV